MSGSWLLLANVQTGAGLQQRTQDSFQATTSNPHLGECDVADICQRCDDEALLHSQVLIAVLKVHITDGDDGGVLVITPVEADLLQPLKVGGVPDLCRQITSVTIAFRCPVVASLSLLLCQ